MAEELRINRMVMGLIVFLLAQAVLGIIWGARLDANVAALSALVEANRSELGKQIDKLDSNVSSGTMLRYTSVDASRDKEMYLQLLTSINKRIDLNEKRIERMESGTFRADPLPKTTP